MFVGRGGGVRYDMVMTNPFPTGYSTPFGIFTPHEIKKAVIYIDHHIRGSRTMY